MSDNLPNDDYDVLDLSPEALVKTFGSVPFTTWIKATYHLGNNIRIKEYEDVLIRQTKDLMDCLGSPVFNKASPTGCVANGRVKSASLLFDRVAVPVHTLHGMYLKGDFDSASMQGVVFVDREAMISSFKSLALAILFFDDLCSRFPDPISDLELPFEYHAYDSELYELMCMYSASSGTSKTLDADTYPKLLSIVSSCSYFEELRRSRGDVVFMLRSRRAREILFDDLDETDNSRFALFSASLSRIPVVADDNLSWEQVREFRADAENRRKYVDFIHWIYSIATARDEVEASAMIQKKLEGYSDALKKYGIETTNGILSSVISPSAVIPAAGGTVAGLPLSSPDHPLAAIFLGGASYLGGVAFNLFKIRSRFMRTRFVENSEIAYLQEATSLAGDSIISISNKT
ncbi:MAG: hypothetical protein AAGB29_03730 [Planctomycetota bacterium]